jgi:hypothetical protein
MPSFNILEIRSVPGSNANIFPRPAASGSVGGADSSVATPTPPRAKPKPRVLGTPVLARTFPIPYATLRNGSLSKCALVTLCRNDSLVVGRQCFHSCMKHSHSLHCGLEECRQLRWLRDAVIPAGARDGARPTRHFQQGLPGRVFSGIHALRQYRLPAGGGG